MNLRAISMLAGATIGMVRLHGIYEQLRMFAAESSLNQAQRLFPLLMGILLLAVPALLMQLGTSQRRLRISESSRGLAIVAALGYAAFTILPSIFQIDRAWSRLKEGQGLWLIAGLAGGLTMVLFLVAFAAEREPLDSSRAPAPFYESSSLRTSSMLTMCATGIAIAIHLLVSALMFTDVYGPQASRQSYLGGPAQILWTRFTGLIPLVVSLVAALLVYLSDVPEKAHYETGVAGGRG